MQAILEILTSLRCKVTFVADNLEYRQPYVGAAAAARRRGAVPSVRRLDRRRCSPSAAASSTSSCCRATTSRSKHIDAVRAFAPERAGRVRHRRPALPARGAAGGARRQRARRAAAARAKRDEELALIRKADVTLVVSARSSRRCWQSSLPRRARDRAVEHPRADAAAASRSPSARASCSSAASSIRRTPTRVLWYAREILPQRARAAARRQDVHRRQQGAGDDHARSPPTTSSSPATSPTSTPYFTRLPRLDLAAALRRRRQGQGQPGDELRPAGRRDDAVDRGHAPVARRATCWSPTMPQAFADGDRARSISDEALWERLAAGGRENIRRALLARRRAQRDHAADRVRRRATAPTASRGAAG